MTSKETKNADERIVDNNGPVEVKSIRTGEKNQLEKERKRIPTYRKVTLTIKEAAEYSNIGINRLETLLKAPRCPFVLYVGNKRLVKRKEFEQFLSDSIQL